MSASWRADGAKKRARGATCARAVPDASAAMDSCFLAGASKETAEAGSWQQLNLLTVRLSCAHTPMCQPYQTFISYIYTHHIYSACSRRSASPRSDPTFNPVLAPTHPPIPSHSPIYSTDDDLTTTALLNTPSSSSDVHPN